MTRIEKMKRASQTCFCMLAIAVIVAAWPLPVSGSSSVGSNPNKSLDIGDPISAKTRYYYFYVPMFDLGGPLPVRYGMFYDSGKQGNFVTPSIRRRGVALEVSYWGDGREKINFGKDAEDKWESGSYSTYRYGLQEETGAGGWFYLMDPSDQTVWIFEKNNSPDDASYQDAHLRYRLDRNGNQVSYTNPTCMGHPTNITDGLGREITGIDDGSDIVSDGARSYIIGYHDHYEDRIITITNPLGDTAIFEYSDHNLTRQVRPEGNSPYTQTYDNDIYPFCSATSQTDAYGNTTTLEQERRDPDMNVPVKETRPDDSAVIYTHLGGASPTSWQDAQGNTANFTVNDNDQMTGITDRLGDTTSMTYHEPTGLLASFTNAKGDTLSHTYTAQGQTLTNPANTYAFTFTFYNRTRTDYPDSTHETFGYDAHGNPTTYTDRNGKTWTTTYNSQGLPLTITNPAGGVVTNTYNPDGTRATSADSDTGTTTYGYDDFKRLSSINPPGTGQIDIAYDAMDQIISVTDENGHCYQNQYDKNGNLTKVTDPAGNATQYGYDLMDRLIQTISRTGGTNTLSYNFLNKVSSATDANGIQTTYAYNNRDWLESTSRNGKTTSFTQDKEGVSTGSTSPAGHTVQQQTDKLGYLSSVILPGGETTQLSRDAMTRVTGRTDSLNRQTQYGYDNNGSLNQVTLPDGSSATYSRDALGNLTGINDLNGHNWGFTYTAMGSLASTSDPLSRTSNYTRDDRGWLATVIYPDGVAETRSYNNTGNLTRSLYSDGTDLTYTYDALDNLTTCNDLALTRDDDERITGSTYNGQTFGATYDAGGRIATATYGGALTVTYSYNADNRLSRVSDTLGNQVDLTYDDDGNLTGLTRSNGINATYTWDSNGRLIRLQDGSLIDLQYGYDAAGQITSIIGTLPLEPAANLLVGAIDSFSVDAASQVNSTGYAYDNRGRATQLPGHNLTWDDAERLAGLDGIGFTYNGQSEIVSRTEGGSTTHHYHHNHALGFSPIVAEQQGAGFTRYYVYTLSGQLLYSIDPQNSNAVAYYHYDQIGSTLALSDGAGAVTDSYAYSPFGELLGRTGSSDQPYTFVGTLGVRQEGNLYQMRRRYYDPVTARFLSKEPIWPQTDNPQSLNPYQYALASPLGTVDVTGLKPTKGKNTKLTSFDMQFLNVWNGSDNVIDRLLGQRQVPKEKPEVISREEPPKMWTLKRLLQRRKNLIRFLNFVNIEFFGFGIIPEGIKMNKDSLGYITGAFICKTLYLTSYDDETEWGELFPDKYSGRPIDLSSP